MRRVVAALVLAGCLFAAWAIPALGGSASPSNKRLERRIDGLAARLKQATSGISTLRSQVANLSARPTPSLRVQQIQGSVSLIAPGVVPHWYIGRASCPLGTSLTGGGIDFSGVYANVPVVETSGPIGNDWVATLRYSGTPSAPTLDVYALCATVS